MKDFLGNSEDKRIRILNGAAKIFTAKGFHQTKVEEIALAAGVGKGTVYEYFNSKNEIFKEMLRYILELYQCYFAEKIDHNLCVWEQLYIIMDTHLNFLAEHKNRFNFILEPHTTLDDEIQSWLINKKAEFLDGLANILQIGIERGEIKPIDTFIGAQIIFGAMVSLSGEAFLAKKDWDSKDVINQTLKILFKGLERE